MAHAIRSIFVSRPVAISRLGRNTVPQDVCARVEAPDPRTDGETTIVPIWSLNVLPAGSVDPVLPTELTFHDEDLSRPVCPVFDDANPASNRHELAPALPEQHREKVPDLTIRVEAHNLKAASCARNPDLGFGTYPPVEIADDNYSSAVLFGVSPPDVRRPLIPRGRNIPLAPMQVLLSQKNRPDADWKEYVNLEVIRLRFTPVQAAQGTRALPLPFLDARAGWFGTPMSSIVQPSDTYDGAERNCDNEPSLGGVFDACEVRIEVSLAQSKPHPRLTAHANVLVGPPDLAPDRRPSCRSPTRSLIGQASIKVFA